MQDRRSALRALLDELRSAKNTEELLFQQMREVTTFWAKSVAVDALSFAGHEHPFGLCVQKHARMPVKYSDLNHSVEGEKRIFLGGG